MRDISIETFSFVESFTYESSGILDEFKSLIVNWRARSYNEFTLTVLLENYTIDLLKNNSILLIDDCFFYVDSVLVDSNTAGLVNVRGKSLLGKATKRIVIPPYSTNSKRPELIAHELLDKNMITPTLSDRRLDYLSLAKAPNFGSDPISFQNSYGVLAEEVEQLCVAYDFCVRENAKNIVTPESEIEFYKGRDLSGDGGVEFRSNFDNLKSEGFEHSISDWATVAYVFGEGEGAKRKQVIVIQDMSTGKPTGLDVNEIYVDARDLQQSYQNEAGQQVTLTDEQYKAQLIQRGEQALSQRLEILNVSGEIDLTNQMFEYKVDYDLGDRVRVTSDLFGLTKTSVLTEMEEVWDTEGYHLTPTFDQESPTIFDKLRRK
nr:MAG TPA: hypothetical protein [Caudoviricetes sp.]